MKKQRKNRPKPSKRFSKPVENRSETFWMVPKTRISLHVNPTYWASPSVVHSLPCSLCEAQTTCSRERRIQFSQAKCIWKPMWEACQEAHSLALRIYLAIKLRRQARGPHNFFIAGTWPHRGLRVWRRRGEWGRTPPPAKAPSL